MYKAFNNTTASTNNNYINTTTTEDHVDDKALTTNPSRTIVVVGSSQLAHKLRYHSSTSHSVTMVETIDAISNFAAKVERFDNPNTVIIVCTIRIESEDVQNELKAANHSLRYSRLCVCADSVHSNCEELFQSLNLHGLIPNSFDANQIHACLSVIGAGVRYLPVQARQLTLSRHQTGQPLKPIGTAWAKLTPRQKQVVQMIAVGQPNKVIAAELGIKESTVKVHVSGLMKRLSATNRQHAAHLVYNGSSPD